MIHPCPVCSLPTDADYCLDHTRRDRGTNTRRWISLTELERRDNERHHPTPERRPTGQCEADTGRAE